MEPDRPGKRAARGRRDDTEVGVVGCVKRGNVYYLKIWPRRCAPWRERPFFVQDARSGWGVGLP